jgi:hypothetical protein
MWPGCEQFLRMSGTAVPCYVTVCRAHPETRYLSFLTYLHLYLSFHPLVYLSPRKKHLNRISAVIFKIVFGQLFIRGLDLGSADDCLDCLCTGDSLPSSCWMCGAFFNTYIYMSIYIYIYICIFDIFWICRSYVGVLNFLHFVSIDNLFV